MVLAKANTRINSRFISSLTWPILALAFDMMVQKYHSMTTPTWCYVNIAFAVMLNHNITRTSDIVSIFFTIWLLKFFLTFSGLNDQCCSSQRWIQSSISQWPLFLETAFQILQCYDVDIINRFYRHQEHILILLQGKN